VAFTVHIVTHATKFMLVRLTEILK